MDNIIYKVYKGIPKTLIYTTFIMDNAIKKYFIYSQENSVVEIWQGEHFIVEYNKNRYYLKVIKNYLEQMVSLIHDR